MLAITFAVAINVNRQQVVSLSISGDSFTSGWHNTYS